MSADRPSLELTLWSQQISSAIVISLCKRSDARRYPSTSVSLDTYPVAYFSPVSQFFAELKCLGRSKRVAPYLKLGVVASDRAGADCSAKAIRWEQKGSLQVSGSGET